jgi:hypothetical protein
MAERVRPIVDLSTTCACGAVSVDVHGPVYSMFLCSCEDCQKATGTGHSAVAIFDSDAVTVTGETSSFNRQAASGATFTRTFCPRCGTPIHGKSSRGELAVGPEPRCGDGTERKVPALMLPVGLFGKAVDWFVPNQLIFSRTHREWDTIAADLPRHETYRQRREEH